jgi:hypothetical protein
MQTLLARGLVGSAFLAHLHETLFGLLIIATFSPAALWSRVKSTAFPTPHELDRAMARSGGGTKVPWGWKLIALRRWAGGSRREWLTLNLTA